jgi:hypothetical protein
VGGIEDSFFQACFTYLNYIAHITTLLCISRISVTTPRKFFLKAALDVFSGEAQTRQSGAVADIISNNSLMLWGEESASTACCSSGEDSTITTCTVLVTGRVSMASLNRLYELGREESAWKSCSCGISSYLRQRFVLVQAHVGVSRTDTVYVSVFPAGKCETYWCYYILEYLVQVHVGASGAAARQSITCS